MTSNRAAETYRTSPTDWHRWSDDDEIGRANVLDAKSVLAASRCIRTGKRFSLALPLAFDGSDPCVPGRQPPSHVMTQHQESYASGQLAPLAGGYQFTDDRFEVSCHGTTHMDALGHAYTDDTVWNGRPAESTASGLPYADVAALGARGVVGRAVLVDLPRSQGIGHLPMHSAISIDDIKTALEDQGTELEPGDILILRTGILTHFYASPASYYEDFAEPGLAYSTEAVDFFRDHDIVGLGSDTLCNEQAHSADLAADYPMHVLLQRNQGVTFHEALWLEEWAEDCNADGRYGAFYVAAPLRLRGCSGAPMNPLVIK